MSWYKTGQVSVTNASRVVTGIGTNFTRFAEAGEAFLGPSLQRLRAAAACLISECGMRRSAHIPQPQRSV